MFTGKSVRAYLTLIVKFLFIQIYLRLLPDGHSAIASTLENIAQVYLSQEEYDQALACLQRALTMQLACLPANHPELADTYFDFGRAYESTNKLDEAADYYMRALKIRETSLPMDHVDKVKTEKCLQRVNDHLAKKRSIHKT
jgi:tetratricopeptide (TPR) repeat protein